MRWMGRLRMYGVERERRQGSISFNSMNTMPEDRLSELWMEIKIRYLTIPTAGAELQESALQTA